MFHNILNILVARILQNPVTTILQKYSLHMQYRSHVSGLVVSASGGQLSCFLSIGPVMS